MTDEFERMEVLPEREPQQPDQSRHKATYTFDRKTGVCRVRLQGPDATIATGYEVPVTSKNGDVTLERLLRRTWSGTDDQSFPGHEATGEPVALYEIEQRVREKKQFKF